MTGRKPPRAARSQGAASWSERRVPVRPPSDMASVTEGLDSAARALAETAISGNLPAAATLAEVRELGRRAAEHGVAAEALIDEYIGGVRQVWGNNRRPRSGDAVRLHASADAVLQAVQSVVASLVAGHQAARQSMIRHEEAVRTEFIDDLLRGDADVAGMVERAQPFGLDLTRAHHVALAEPTAADGALDQLALRLERAVVDRYGDREVLVATKDQRIVVLMPGVIEQAADATESTLSLSRFLDGQLHDWTGQTWRVGAGRAFRGAFGVARSYEEARETLELASRLGLATPSLNPGQVLVYRVLARDQAAIIDLIDTVLGPLTRARGGAGPLLDTLQTYFASGATATHTARRMHLSVRAVTYRLDRVKQLTGYDPAQPEQRFVLHAAVLGARMLDWPARALPHTP